MRRSSPAHGRRDKLLKALVSRSAFVMPRTSAYSAVLPVTRNAKSFSGSVTGPRDPTRHLRLTTQWGFRMRTKEVLAERRCDQRCLSMKGQKYCPSFRAFGARQLYKDILSPYSRDRSGENFYWTNHLNHPLDCTGENYLTHRLNHSPDWSDENFSVRKYSSLFLSGYRC